MRRSLITGIIVATVALIAAPANAITYGQIDNGKHPAVGALIAEFDGVKEELCSGTLIDEDLFLTAAHCTAYLTSQGITDVWVSFSDDVDPVDDGTLVSGSYLTNPKYSHAQSDPGDMALVFLDEDQSMTPAVLPAIGRFDQMKKAGTLQKSKFTAVGYGVQERQNGGGQPTFPYDGLRRWSVESFNSLNNAWLRLSQNPSKGDSGACYGDSGGPNFLGSGGSETNVIAATTITGDTPCTSTNVVYRMDTKAAHAFIDPYID